ncbi:hypothetical protein PMAYCL1PPCAC_23069, partial [Pristionchus mayeri]
VRRDNFECCTSECAVEAAPGKSAGIINSSCAMCKSKVSISDDERKVLFTIDGPCYCKGCCCCEDKFPMSLRFLDLPQGAIYSTFYFLDDSSLLLLREECKEIKKIVESPALMNSRKICISWFNINEGKHGTKISITVSTKKDIVFLSWSFESILDELENTTLDRITNRRQLNACLSKDELRRFLEYLKPLI